MNVLSKKQIKFWRWKQIEMNKIITIAALVCMLLAVSCSSEESQTSEPADLTTFEYDRPENGDPISDEEISAVTQRYLELLNGTRYFDVVDERTHGWPQSDPEGRFWYGSWWSGVTISKEENRVTYLHSEDGADNNGLRTAPLLESACFALLTWEDQKYELLIRKLIRGFSSWILAMERNAAPEQMALMTRASYPESVLSTDGGHEIWIDYSLNRPGLDNGATEYVHIQDNPYWGDIWIKNKRSKDDLGHLYRSIAQLAPCIELTDNADIKDDYQQMEDLYRSFAMQVAGDEWSMATFDKDLNIWTPPELLAHFIEDMNAECPGILTLQLFAFGDPGPWDCGNGISEVDEVISLQPHSAQIIRSFHESAVSMAFLTGDFALALSLLDGLAIRIETILDQFESADPPEHPIKEDMAELIIQSANVGLPLTWREIRYVHQRIDEAHAAYLDSANELTYNIFDENTPDGAYSFDPPGEGFFFRNIGLVLGACAAPYQSTTAKPILDCDLVRQSQ
jgi:hypothetical protein